MNAPPRLGRLEAVALRETWFSEPGHFTPWLAEPDNLGLLGETLGLDLEVDAVEKPVGPYRADILCREVASDRLVLIENQIETTDHKHLGQLLTYAAGLDTAVICWIARRFTDQHRAVLDWLNLATDERFAFFGIEIELWRIGDSPPAPRFNVVARPNDWRGAVAKEAGHVRASEPVGIDINRVAYWQAFEELLEAQGAVLRPRGRPPRSGVYSFTLGRNVYLYAYRDVALREVGVFLGLHGEGARLTFDRLAAERQAIEQAIGAPLEWCIMTAEKNYRIVQKLLHADALVEDDWPRQHAWLIERLEAFDAVFRQRVAMAAGEEERVLA